MVWLTDLEVNCNLCSSLKTRSKSAQLMLLFLSSTDQIEKLTNVRDFKGCYAFLGVILCSGKILCKRIIVGMLSYPYIEKRIF